MSEQTINLMWDISKGRYGRPIRAALLLCEKLEDEVAAGRHLLKAAEGAYTVLGDITCRWEGRDTPEGQMLLNDLRDAICDATGRDAQEVQDDYCNRRLAARTSAATA